MLTDRSVCTPGSWNVSVSETALCFGLIKSPNTHTHTHVQTHTPSTCWFVTKPKSTSSTLQARSHLLHT